MYNRGKQRLDELEDKLAALRQEARSGYGKDEVRRNRIKADLEADRLAKEKHARERLQFLTSSGDHASAMPSANDGRRRTSGTTMVDLDGEEEGGASRGLAPHEEGDFADLLLREMDGSGLVDEALADAVVNVVQLHVDNYRALLALTDDYDYDAQLDAKLKRVQGRDAATGLPTVMRATSQVEDPTGLDLNLSGALQRMDGGHSMPSPGFAESCGGETDPDGQPATLIQERTCQRSRSSQSRSAVASRDAQRTSAVTTMSRHPIAPRPPRAALSTQGTAVAVSHGHAQVRALQKLVREKKQRQAALAQAETCAGSTTRSTARTPSTQWQSMWPPLTETITRVLTPTVVLFCQACTRLFETELKTAATPPPSPSCVPRLVATDEAHHSVRVCPHCGAAVILETGEAWWSAAPVTDPLIGARFPPLSAHVHDQTVAAQCRPEAVTAVAAAVSGGTDSIGFPDDDADDAGSFQAALAQVRAAIAASKKAPTAQSPSSTGVGSSTRNHPMGVSTGTTTEKETELDPTALAKRWADSLKGVFLMHLWDAQQDQVS